MNNLCGNTEFGHDEEFHEGEHLTHLFLDKYTSLLKL